MPISRPAPAIEPMRAIPSSRSALPGPIISSPSKTMRMRRRPAESVGMFRALSSWIACPVSQARRSGARPRHWTRPLPPPIRGIMHEDATMIRPDDPDHRAWALRDAARQLDLFRASLDPAGGFFQLGRDGTPVPGRPRELHATARLVHSYALGKLAGFKECDTMIDAGMRDLSRNHRDSIHGGYLWSLDADGVRDGRKLAYGHVFVLLAGSSALAVGHPDAQALIDDVTEVLDARFWEDGTGRFCDEFNRDWTPFSDYRGMNANMHGIEALLAAHEA